MQNQNWMEMLALFAGVLLMAWIGFGVLQGPAPTPAFSPQLQAGGQVAVSTANAQLFAQRAAAAGSECGDLNDQQNLQHLSHHPDRYADCLRAADQAKLRAAAGRTAQEILGG